MNYSYIDNDQAMKAFQKSLKEEYISSLAVDLEGEFNLHCYGEHLCLIQVYTGKDFYLLDPFGVSKSLLKEFLEDSKTLKIFYDCSGDRTLLVRTMDIHPRCILDLAPAVELLDYQQKGLSKVLETALGVEPVSKKKFQQYNWMKRPIDGEALDYALTDVAHLFELKDLLLKDLQSQSLMENYILKNLEAQSREIKLNPIPGVMKKERFKRMPSASRKLFKALFNSREAIAKAVNQPPNNLLSNNDLFSLSLGEKGLNQVRLSPRMPQRKQKELKDNLERIFKEYPLS